MWQRNADGMVRCLLMEHNAVGKSCPSVFFVFFSGLLFRIYFKRSFFRFKIVSHRTFTEFVSRRVVLLLCQRLEDLGGGVVGRCIQRTSTEGMAGRCGLTMSGRSTCPSRIHGIPHKAFSTHRNSDRHSHWPFRMVLSPQQNYRSP